MNTKTGEGGRWAQWGLIPRLMVAVGVAVSIGGGVQTFLQVAEGAADSAARLNREGIESIKFMAPLVADLALVGEYAAIQQLLRTQVKRGDVDVFAWIDAGGKEIREQDVPVQPLAPRWFSVLLNLPDVNESVPVASGGVGYGTLRVEMTPIRVHNTLWKQFVKQLQILAVTLFLMLQFIWLIFRGNLGTIHMLAVGRQSIQPGRPQRAH